MDLHYSQTIIKTAYSRESLNPLWIYTTLKRGNWRVSKIKGLNPLWIYTTLKL